jgi:hypothetical protein
LPGSAKRAKVARKGRSQIARTFTALENGKIGVRVVLETPPAHLGRIRVYDVLRRFPHLGRDGAETVCRRARVWPLTTMDNLTPEERERIWHALPPRAK